MRLTLGLVLLIACFAVRGQPVIVEPVPPSAPASSELRAPNGLTSHTSLRAHMILRTSELAHLPAGFNPLSFGFNYIYGVATPAGGNFKVYLENTPDQTNQKSQTWATAISTMTLVYDGPLNLPVSDDATSIDLPLNGSPFTYTGGGLYVAYEYAGTTFAQSGGQAGYRSNSELAASLFMGSSGTTTMPATVATSTAFRPQVRFGVANPFVVDLSVDALAAKYGTLHALWEDEVTLTISNRGHHDRTDVQAQVQVTGANTAHQDFVEPFLAAGASQTFVMAPLAYLGTGTNTVTATVAADDNPANNEREIAQQVSCDVLAYVDETPAFDGIGFNTGSGILAVRYEAPPVPIVVSAISVGIHSGTNSVGKTVAARLLDGDGQVIGTSPSVVLESSHLGEWLEFTLDAPVTIAADADVYAGLLQNAGSPGYFPVATNPPADIAPNLVYSFGTTGGTGTMYTSLGMLRIGLHATPGLALDSVPVSPVEGSPVTLTATAGYDDYQFLVNGQAVQQGASNAYAYVPADGDVVTVVVVRNGCGETAESTIQVTPIHVFSDGFEPADTP